MVLPAQNQFNHPQTGISRKRLILTTVAGSLLSFIFAVLILGATGALAFNLKQAVGEALGNVTGITEVVVKQVVDPITREIPLSLLPTGSGKGLDADLLDGLHAASFALKADLDVATGDLTKKIDEVTETVGSLDFSPYLKKIEQAADSLKLAGKDAGYYLNASNLSSGTLLDTRLSTNVSLLDLAQTFTAGKTFSAGLTVSGGTLTLPAGSITSSFIADGSITNSDVSSSAAIQYSKLNLATSISGSDLTSNISVSTSGNIVLTGSGALTSAGAISAPSSINTINGLVISSGNATLANLTTSTGSLTSTVADGATAVGFLLATSTTYSTSGAKVLSIKNNTTELLSLNKDGLLTINGSLVSTGTIQGTQLISTIATGTPPLVVSSTTQVANLNASLLGGNSSSTLMSYPQPNLILNSDFSRRNKWMTFMPETFTDISGVTVEQGGSNHNVSANLLVPGSLPGTGDLRWKGSLGLSTWRDARYSAQIKWCASCGHTYLYQYQNDSNWVGTMTDGSTHRMTKNVSATQTQLQSDAITALTDGNFYWLELETQGVGTSNGKAIAKFYTCPVAATACAKSAATLNNTIVQGITDSGLAVGGKLAVGASSTSMRFGGLSTGDGGVYVEGWGPESWAPIFSGTKGGQAFGFDEADGPLTYPWSIRMYKPAANRGLQIDWDTVTNPLVGAPRIKSSTAYTLATYIKTAGTAGAGHMLVQADTWTNAAAFLTSNAISDNQEVSWTRKTLAFTSDPTATQLRIRFQLNAAVGSGTYYIQLLQLEEGSTVTPWRSAPADDSPIVWRLQMPGNYPSNITLSGCWCDIEPRDAAGNLFIPWDANITATAQAEVTTTGSAGHIHIAPTVDGTSFQVNGASNVGIVRSYWQTGELGFTKLLSGTATKAVTAGKHRFYLGGYYSGGGATVQTGPANGLTVIATRGK